MSWRSNSQRTGANEAPLANQRNWGGGRDGPPGGGGGGGGGGGYGSYGGGGGGGQSSYGNSGGYNNQNSRGYNDGGYAQQAMPRHGEANGYAAQAPPPPSSTAGALVGPPAERKRKSRWGDENDKIQVAGLPTAISGDVSGKDLENYATHVRLEEISRKLKSGDVVPPERERSPSPPPTYDHHGRRTNTRDIRYRKKLEDERNKLVDKALRNDPNYKPPTEYLMQKRMSGRPQEKIFIPVKEFPEIKWIGLILGPRGNSLKAMEKDTGAKIVIRGKGSTKEGKGTFGNRSADEDDELHCNVTADSQDKVDACVRLINRVIATAASTPDEQNDHKRSQLRELAMLNGTLRDDENQPCQNCGKVGHRKYDCPEERNFTASIVCRNCGNMGHMARDCIAHRKPGGGPATTPQFDSEYSALMAELGEGPGLSSGGGGGGAITGPDAGRGDPNGNHQPSSAIPPWRISTNWHPPQPPSQGPGGRSGMNYQPYGAYGAPGGGAGAGYAAAYGGPSQPGAYDYSQYYGAGQQQAYGAQYGATYPGYQGIAA